MNEKKTLYLPFVGRESEFDLLKLMLESASRGDGNTVFITGKTGIGKSRLAEELKNYAFKNGFVCISKSFIQSPRLLSPFFEAKSGESTVTYTSFDALFTINHGGLLVASASKGDERFDSAIFSGMLTAIQYFIQDSFGDLKSGLELDGVGKLEYKDKRILIQSGKHIFVAGVLKGEEHPDMRHDLKNLIIQFEHEFGDILSSWDGDTTKVRGMQDDLFNILGKQYELGIQLEDINLEINKLRTFESITATLIAQAQNEKKKGLLLLLDDAHLADDFSFSFLQYLARNSRNIRILTCIFLRSEELEPAKNEIIKNMELEGICRRFELKPLSFDAISTLFFNIFDQKPPVQFLKLFFEYTEGNPFYMKEYLQALYDENLIYYDKKWQFNSTAYEKLPKNAVDIISHRLDRLPPDELNLLELCAVFGDKIALKIFSDCFSDVFEYEKIQYNLKKLVEKRILISDTDEYEFEHLILRKMIYDDIGMRRKRILHAKIASYFEKSQLSFTEKIYQLAYHYSNTANYWKAVEYNIRAADIAVKNYAPVEGENFYSNAISVLDKLVLTPYVKQRKFMLLEKLGDTAMISYNYENAVSSYKAGAELTDDNESAARLYRKIGICFKNTGCYPDAIKYLTAGMSTISNKQQCIEYGRLCTQLADVLLREGDYYKAMRYSNDALKNFDRCKASKTDYGFVYQVIGNIYFNMGEAEKAFENYEKSLNYRQQIGDTLGGSMIYNNLGLLFKSKGHHEKAIWYFKKSLALKTGICDYCGLGLVYNNLGTTYYSMGRYKDALSAYMKSMDIRQKIGDLRGIAKVCNNMYITYEDLKDFENAYKWKKKYSEIMEKIGLGWRRKERIEEM